MGDFEKGLIIGLVIGLPLGICLGWIIFHVFSGGSQSKPLAEQPKLQNIEEVEWVDWRNRPRRVVIHRRVE
jgi:hypothetical protein